RHSMAVRVPSIIDDVIERNADYPPEISDAFRRLRDEIAGDAPLRLFALPSPDFDLWRPRFAVHTDESWLDAEWFFAEMLAYRLMMEAGRYWSTLRDPFAPFKREELSSEALWSLLGEALALEGPIEERIYRMLLLNLWGNRIDLSLSNVAAKGTGASQEHLLADHASLAARHLTGDRGDGPAGAAARASGIREPGTVHVIMDNAGTEEAMDLVLADLLLREDLAVNVVMHVKQLPVLVSDVITADVHEMVEAMKARGGEARRLAGRLDGYLESGRLRLVPDAFWNTDGRLWELPARLADAFEGASLVIGKGDVNYRRATNDALWPLETTLKEAVGTFPAPLLLLRTLKSDTLVEVAPDRAAALEADEPDWRTNGSYGVIQYAFGPPVIR
ncbi:MAG: damage-control phosphatase ARMT1 family protein, partial [Rhodothermales bacterium]